MKVYLNDPIDPAAFERLAGHVEIVTGFEHPEELDAIIVRQKYVTRDVIARAKRCRLIQQHGTGLDRIDTRAAREYGIPVRNTPGINAQSVAEYAMLLILALSRNARVIDRRVREGSIASFGAPGTVGTEVRGKRLGLVGSGNVAQRLGEMAKNGFSMEVMCFSGHRAPDEVRALGFEPASSPEELFERCDYVSLHSLLTEETRHMVGRELLRHAKPGMILINTARGGLVDEKALYEALTNGTIAAAGLDVFEKEPPDAADPLLSLDNVIAGMHVGGSTREAMARNGKIVVDNVFAALGIDEKEG